jgi:bifunctional non-homologous end joining protein LigD
MDDFPIQLSRIDPMLLAKKEAAPFTDPAWLFEVKHDGYRLLAEINHGQVRLKTRQGQDATEWFPEIVAELRVLKGHHVIDGEVVVLDQAGRSDFGRLHARALLRKSASDVDDPVVFVAFDLLVTEGVSVMQDPLLVRKMLLQSLLPRESKAVTFLSHTVGDGLWLYQQAVASGQEGIVAKRAQSRYTQGTRSNDWIKIKPPSAAPARRQA